MITNFHNKKNAQRKSIMQVFINNNAILLLEQIKSITLEHF